MTRRAATSVFCVIALPQLIPGADKPERLVEGRTVISHTLPAARIELPAATSYVGADRWVLYDIADCEVHVFVEPDANNVVRRLYWIQFEGFIPARPELKYNYGSDPIQQFHGMDFHVSARFGPTDDVPRTGSDLAHVRQMIRSRGYTMPPGMMNVRLVHLLNPRRELMIIYGENTSEAGVAWSDLQPGGRAADKWSGIQKALLQRAESKIAIRRTGAN